MGRSSTTLSGRAYEALRQEITTGRLCPGDRLVRRDIAKRLGVSTIPVIEALLRLEQDGLVESKPNRGARVKPLTMETIGDECVLREALECQVARMVAEKHSASQMSELRTAARKLDAMMKRVDAGSRIGMELHMELHLRLAEIADCPLLADQLRSVWLRHLMQLNWVNAALLPVPDEWHARLVSVLEHRQPDAAEAAMREHVRYGQKTIRDALQMVRADREAGTTGGESC